MQTLRWIAGLAMIVAIFYWKILLSDQFTLLWQWELTNQSYARFHFTATSIQHGNLPALGLRGHRSGLAPPRQPSLHRAVVQIKQHRQVGIVPLEINLGVRA